MKVTVIFLVTLTCLVEMGFGNSNVGVNNKPAFPPMKKVVGLWRKCREGDAAGIKEMMTKWGPEAIVHAKNYIQATCLHMAAAEGHPEVITLLIQNGANPDPKDKWGDTPLRRAIRRRKYSSVETLLALGASMEKAKESKYLKSAFKSGLKDEKTKAAIAEGQRIAEDEWILVLRHDFTVPESSKFKDGLWKDYRDGFGSSTQKVFWLGLEELHRLTSGGKWRLKVKVKWDKKWNGKDYKDDDFRTGTYGESEWNDFKVGSEATNYQLGIGNQLSKDNWEGDPFSIHNGMAFTTKDRDNDRKSGDNCASLLHGGWWFEGCLHICLTCMRPNNVIYDGLRALSPSLAEIWIKKV